MRRLAGLAVVLLAAFTGCASPSATPSPNDPVLDGTSWVVTRIGGAETISAARPSLSVSDGTVHGSAGCNSYVAEFAQTGSSIRVSEVALTAMACLDDGVMEQETAFVTALAEVTGVRSQGAGLELVNAKDDAVLTLAAAPTATPEPLVGTVWTLEGIVSGDSVSSPLAGTTVSLSFTADTVSGTACNTFRGEVSIDDGSLSVGPLVATRALCPTEQETAQEATVLALLQQAASYTVAGDTLTLSTPARKGLVFTAT
ncbi:META domain-containing protein [Propionicicella superfundia]|uniref:META domain-containing protein n=1 Tax=Propionicicella superfundia TaxID=348582 RepID=UPI000427DDD5|nr:META domain-containing protein [Propionicicella superfundia]